MIPDYCYDCMSRQMPMTQMPGTPTTMYGYPTQGMYQPQMTPVIPGSQVQPMVPGGFTQNVATGTQNVSQVQTDIGYTQGWLRTQIGQRVKIEFLIGTNMLIDRDGTLLDVGISYVLLREAETDDLLMCDIYSIKFVRVYL